MSSEKRPLQHVSQTISFPGGETYRMPQLIPVCCICGLVRNDESAPPHQSASWITLKAYRSTLAVSPVHFLFTHTYCPHCLRQVQEKVREYFSAKGKEEFYVRRQGH